MSELKPHPAADLFPMMDDQRLQELAEDIAENGLREPIVLLGDLILDGRNRAAACRIAGVEPRTEQAPEDLDPYAYVWSLNGQRRDLIEAQRYLIWKRVSAESEAWQEARERIKEEESRRKAEAAARKERDAAGRMVPSPQRAPKVHIVAKSPVRPSRKAKAKIAGVGVGTVQKMDTLTNKRPDLAEKVERGEMKPTHALRQMREDKREERRKENAAKVADVKFVSDVAEVDAKFATIVIDPPWDWGDEGDVNQMGRAKPDYHTMSLGELMDLPVGDLADVDCHIYLWITNRSLPKGFQLLEKWGFRYITAITWVKPSFGMGNYFRGQTEHVLFGVKGSQGLKRRDLGTVFHAKRGPNGHSSKPVEFYDLVESASPGPYIELFSRVKREGWVSWGESGHA